MAWRAKRFGPKITKAHWRLHYGLDDDGILHFINIYLQGKTRPWNVDVYIPSWLIVEVDGSSHVGKQLEKDEFKTRDLENAELPFTVIRFWDHNINNELTKTLILIYTTLTWGPHLTREGLYSLASTSMKKPYGKIGGAFLADWNLTGRDHT